MYLSIRVNAIYIPVRDTSVLLNCLSTRWEGTSMAAYLILLVLCLFCTPICTYEGVSPALTGKPQNCPGRHCKCTWGQSDTILAANCTLSNGSLRNIVERLPSSILNLTIMVEHLEENGTSFSKFDALKKLEIMWTLPPEEIRRPPYIHNFSYSPLFEGLSNLTILRINLPTTDMALDLLRPLDSLETLDFSNMGYFTTSNLAQVFNKSGMQLKPLTTLLLARLSGANPTIPMQFQFKELLPLCKGHHIQRMDISFNGEIHLYPGVLMYLPFVEHVESQGMSIRYDDKKLLELNCLMIEIFLHQKLQYMDLSNSYTMGFGFFDTVIGEFVKSYIKAWLTCLLHQHLPKKQCICNTHIEKCGSLFPNKISCEYFPSELNPLDWINVMCDSWYNIPLPFNLRVFKLRDNDFSFVYPPKWTIQTRCFAKNNMKLLDLSYGTFSSPSAGIYTFRGFEGLEALILEYSDWGSYFLNPKFLETWPGLKNLNMAGTTVGVYIANDTRNDIFKFSQNLTKLILRDAKITTIPAREFSPLSELIHFDLSENNMKNISFDIYNLTSLGFFNVSNNKLVNLTADLSDLLDANGKQHKVLVDLSGNLLSCNCDSFKFLKWIHRTKVQFANKHGYLCVHPDGLQRLVNVLQNLESLRRRCFPPPDYTMYIACGTVLLSSLMLGLLFLFIYRMRWKIRVCCLWLKYRNELDEKKNYKYDAFVVYSDEDRYWVHHVMLNKLERKCGLRLCIHHRDFVPGHEIEENIVTHMNASRKTILVISPDFLRSQWCQEEVQIARNRLFSEGRNVFVPIILIDCPKKTLTHTVRNVLASTTYVSWSDSSSQQEYFWKKLTLSIGRKSASANATRGHHSTTTSGE